MDKNNISDIQIEIEEKRLLSKVYNLQQLWGTDKIKEEIKKWDKVQIEAVERLLTMIQFGSLSLIHISNISTDDLIIRIRYIEREIDQFSSLITAGIPAVISPQTETLIHKWTWHVEMGKTLINWGVRLHNVIFYSAMTIVCMQVILYFLVPLMNLQYGIGAPLITSFSKAYTIFHKIVCENFVNQVIMMYSCNYIILSLFGTPFGLKLFALLVGFMLKITTEGMRDLFTKGYSSLVPSFIKAMIEGFKISFSQIKHGQWAIQTIAYIVAFFVRIMCTKLVDVVERIFPSTLAYVLTILASGGATVVSWSSAWVSWFPSESEKIVHEIGSIRSRETVLGTWFFGWVETIANVLSQTSQTVLGDMVFGIYDKYEKCRKDKLNTQECKDVQFKFLGSVEQLTVDAKSAKDPANPVEREFIERADRLLLVDDALGKISTFFKDWGVYVIIGLIFIVVGVMLYLLNREKTGESITEDDVFNDIPDIPLDEIAPMTDTEWVQFRNGVKLVVSCIQDRNLTNCRDAIKELKKFDIGDNHIQLNVPVAVEVLDIERTYPELAKKKKKQAPRRRSKSNSRSKSKSKKSKPRAA